MMASNVSFAEKTRAVLFRLTSMPSKTTTSMSSSQVVESTTARWLLAGEAQPDAEGKDPLDWEYVMSLLLFLVILLGVVAVVVVVTCLVALIRYCRSCLRAGGAKPSDEDEESEAESPGDRPRPKPKPWLPFSTSLGTEPCSRFQRWGRGILSRGSSAKDPDEGKPDGRHAASPKVKKSPFLRSSSFPNLPTPMGEVPFQSGPPPRPLEVPFQSGPPPRSSSSELDATTPGRTSDLETVLEEVSLEPEIATASSFQPPISVEDRQAEFDKGTCRSCQATHSTADAATGCSYFFALLTGLELVRVYGMNRLERHRYLNTPKHGTLSLMGMSEAFP